MRVSHPLSGCRGRRKAPTAGPRRGEEKEEERLQLRGEVGQKRQTHWGGEDVAPLYLSSRESLLPLVGFGINGGGISAGSR